MTRWIVASSLKFRRLVLALAVGVLVAGIVQVGKTPVDVLPEFNPPMVEVQTEALGLSAEEVEQLITVPLEQDLLAGVAFLDEIESVSLPGLSSVVMTFEPGTDVLDARQVVQERLTQAVGVAGLPQVAKLPQMIQPLSSSNRLSMIKLSSDDLSPIEVSVLARWVITPRLMGVPGVANVSVWGFRDRQLQVLVDPARLKQNATTLQQVIETTGNALEVSPLSFLEASTPGTGGFIDTVNQRLDIFHEQAISTAEELAQVPLEGQGGGGTPKALGDVAKVVEDHQPLIGDAICPGGEQCLLLVVEKFPGANTVEVTKGVEAALAAMRPGLGDMRIDSSLYRPASFIESSFERLRLGAAGRWAAPAAPPRRALLGLAPAAGQRGTHPGGARRGGARAVPARRPGQLHGRRRARPRPHRRAPRRDHRHPPPGRPAAPPPAGRRRLRCGPRSSTRPRRRAARSSTPSWSSRPPSSPCSSWAARVARSCLRSCCPTCWRSRPPCWWPSPSPPCWPRCCWATRRSADGVPGGRPAAERLRPDGARAGHPHRRRPGRGRRGGRDRPGGHAVPGHLAAAVPQGARRAGPRRGPAGHLAAADDRDHPAGRAGPRVAAGRRQRRRPGGPGRDVGPDRQRQLGRDLGQGRPRGRLRRHRGRHPGHRRRLPGRVDRRPDALGRARHRRPRALRTTTSSCASTARTWTC